MVLARLPSSGKASDREAVSYQAHRKASTISQLRGFHSTPTDYRLRLIDRQSRFARIPLVFQGAKLEEPARAVRRFSRSIAMPESPAPRGPANDSPEIEDEAPGPGR